MKTKTTYLGCVVALMGALALPTASAARPHLESPALSTAPVASFISRTPLLDSAPRHLSTASWWGGTYSAPDRRHGLHLDELPGSRRRCPALG